MSDVRVLLGIVLWGMASHVMASSLREDLVEAVSTTSAVSSNASHAPVKRVVWDIDDVLCQDIRSQDKTDVLNKIRTLFPECRIVAVTISREDLAKDECFIQEESETFIHVFLPFIEEALLYVHEQNWENYFFSSGHEVRNQALMENYLPQVYGAECYQQLFRENGNRIFSNCHLSDGYYGKKTKDLNTVIPPIDKVSGVGIKNTILVDDQFSYAQKGQESMIVGKGSYQLFRDDIDMYSNTKSPSPGNVGIHPLADNKVLQMNQVYYFLGILDSCAEKIKSNPGLDLRSALDMVLPRDCSHKKYRSGHDYKIDSCIWPELSDPVIYKLAKRGLKIVQKKHPSARFYIPNNGWAKADLLKVMQEANDADDVSSVSSLADFDRVSKN